MYNLRFLLDSNKIEPYVETDNKIFKFDKAKILERNKIIMDLIKGVGFENIMDKKLIERETFKENIKKVMENCVLFTDIANSGPLFGFNKSKISSVKSFLGFVNSLLKNWGLKNFKINKIQKKINFYQINFIDNIDKYL